ncbi:MAG: hypothetical protein HYT87_03175 [Nitrospirae bacterium]|nr:hypothetical protein [Nitrospirota bacterium]
METRNPLVLILLTSAFSLACSEVSEKDVAPITPKSCSPLQTVVRQPGLIPDDIEISPDGTELWVASTDQSAVLRFDAVSGAPLDPPWIQNVPFPWALAIGPESNPALWVTESNAGVLHRLDPVTRADRTVLDSLSLPMDIAFDQRGRLTLCESKGPFFAFPESWVTRFEGPADDPTSRSTLLSGLPGACDITYSSGGSLYVVAANSTSILRLSGTGKMETVPTAIQSPTDVIFHPATGGLLVSQLDEVVWINPENGHSVRVACDGISHAEDLAVAPDGTVYLSESLGGDISRFEIIPESQP